MTGIDFLGPAPDIQEMRYMGFRIDLKGHKTPIGKVMFNDIDLSNRVMKVTIIAAAGDIPYALLKVTLEKLNGVDIMPLSDDPKEA
jgi:hypothetical protein